MASNILEDLLVEALDCSLGDVNLQVGRADIVLSALGIKRLVLEVKRPGAFVWNRRAVEEARDQSQRYAAVQRVGAVAVSDGHLLSAADVSTSGLRDRILVALDTDQAPEELWWISVHGIYRPCPAPSLGVMLPAGVTDPVGATIDVGTLVHPTYHLPARCFAYVGAADDPHRWKLPYLTEAGPPDTKRLPKAIQAILSNYRGARVDIPREMVGDVLVRLATASAVLRELPCLCNPAADAYVEAHLALEQPDRAAYVGCCTARSWDHPASPWSRQFVSRRLWPGRIGPDQRRR
ncbi:MAG: hypothetical protein ACYCXY_11365 [Acidimicrobiales bacterium]